MREMTREQAIKEFSGKPVKVATFWGFTLADAVIRPYMGTVHAYVQGPNELSVIYSLPC